MQKEIWSYMQEIIHENPFKKPEDDQEFYLQMVDKIYEYYWKLHFSSLEIEKIINLFNSMGEEEPEFVEDHNLDISTFNYLVESD